MKLTTASFVLAAATMLSSSADAFLPGPSLAAHGKAACSSIMARSENSKRTNDRSRGNRGGPQEYGNDHGGYGGGQEFDYSGGNLKYGTGKYTQRENDGYQGGVNMSRNGRSMQDNVYRQDRENVDRAMGRNREDFSRMDEVEDMERGMGGGRSFHNGARDRMGGGGLLRDQQRIGDRREVFDEFGAPPTIMGGSSSRRQGGYRSRQFENGLSNERRLYEEYGHRMDEFDDMDRGMGGGFEGRRRNGGPSNFDRMMGRDGFDRMEARMERRDMNMRGGRDFDDYGDDRYFGGDDRGMMNGSRGRSGRGGEYYDDEGYGDDRGRGEGRLLRDHRRN